MNLSHLMLFANHAWQSTLFVLVAGLLTLAFRGNRAAVRHAIWLTASMKFLVPFSALIYLGSFFHATVRSEPREAVSTLIDRIAEPFAPVAILDPLTASVPLQTLNSYSWLPAAIATVWLAGATLLLAVWAKQWLWLLRLNKRGTPLDLGLPIPVVAVPSSLEPGVFGIRRPILLVPAGIMEELSPAQLETVMAHELCHVRRRDNLSSSLQMLVGSFFWFHPLVWWIERRLVDEQERACDEHVLKSGGNPEIYAQAILKVCSIYSQPPACVSGISGSSLKSRIAQIMNGKLPQPLGRMKRFLLAGVVLTPVITPFLFGSIYGSTQREATHPTLSFDVASIKPISDFSNGMTGFSTGKNGVLVIGAQSLKAMIVYAYGVLDIQVSGGPAWVQSDRYHVEGKTEVVIEDPHERQTQMKWMLQTLLTDRFALKMHGETRQADGFQLVVARGGAKLKPASGAEIVTPRPEGSAIKSMSFMLCGTSGRDGSSILLPGQSIAQLASCLSSILRGPVMDKTGIDGTYDIEVKGFESPGLLMAGPSEPSMQPSLTSALEEQAGLRLISSKVPLETFVIESAERPVEQAAYAPGSLIVKVDSKGVYSINESVVESSVLIARVRDAIAAGGATAVVVEGDPDAPFSAVVKGLDASRAAGAHKVGLIKARETSDVTEPLPSTPPSASPPVDARQSLVVRMNRDETLFLNEVQIDFADLINQVRTVVQSRRDRTLMMEAAADLPFKDVARVIASLKSAGADPIGLMSKTP